MRRSGVVTERRRKREQGKRIRRRAMLAGGVLLLCALAMSTDLRDGIKRRVQDGFAAAQTFASVRTESVEVTLPGFEVYALQLGVYDSGERAQSEQQRLTGEGVPCIVWQRDKMRIVCAVAKTREALDLKASGGNEGYVITDTLPEVRLRLSSATGESEAAAQIVRLPDALLEELLSSGGRSLEQMASETRTLAQEALAAHPENLLYAQLAQSLLSWCDLQENKTDVKSTRSYAAVTMCTICREWRVALLGNYSLSVPSTASAQRTPSTAADVMPPA